MKGHLDKGEENKHRQISEHFEIVKPSFRKPHLTHTLVIIHVDGTTTQREDKSPKLCSNQLQLTGFPHGVPSITMTPDTPQTMTRTIALRYQAQAQDCLNV